MSEERVNRRFTGTVASSKMDKTITVVVERLVQHSVYGKFIRRRTKLTAHDEANECNEGDTVIVERCRPLSKRTSWRLVEIVERRVAA